MIQTFFTRDRRGLTRRLAPVFFGFLVFLLVVLIRVFYLQAALGKEFRKRSEVNRIQHRTIPAQRGVIRDANGVVLAADEPIFHLVQEEASDLDRHALTLLSRRMKLEPEALRRRIRARSRIILRRMTDAQRIWFAEHSRQFPGFEVRIRPKRFYRYGAKAASVIGYTGEISLSELNRRRGEGLTQGDIVGKTGIEKTYDPHLQGRDGIRWVETTARGDLIRTLKSPAPIPPRAGSDLKLYLDVELQARVASSFPADSAGAAVVMEIPSGKVRALYSHPSYNPNQLVLGSSRRIQRLLDDPDDPLHNRAVQSRFPPGSTFKILPYLSALADSGITPGRTYSCPGQYWFGGREYKCWKEEGHGNLSLDQAVIHSCNVYFYKLIRDLGMRKVARLGRAVNYFQPTGIDMPGEVAPQLSSPRWKRDVLGRPWYPGDALNAVIGQGYTLVSPIKQAQILGSVISGRIVTPKLAHPAAEQPPNRRLPIPDSHRRRLIRTLDAVADQGTGYWAQHDTSYRPLKPDLIGKTGTVQKVKLADMEDTPPSDAWFVSAAPRSDPRYVVVVFRGEGGSGGQVGAPHARRIYQIMKQLGYFNGRRFGPPDSSMVRRQNKSTDQRASRR